MVTAIMGSAFCESPAWILLAVGFYFSLRILKFPDLTVEATFIAGTVGAAVGAVYFDSSAVGFVYAVFLSGIGGALTGLLYWLHRTPIFKLLSSIIVVFSFYAINFRILGGKADINFSSSHIFYNSLADFDIRHGFISFRYATTSFGLLLCAIIIFLLFKLLKSKWGLLLRSLGYRPSLIRSLGFKIDINLIFGLFVSNMIVGIGGWIFGSTNGYSNINIFGTIIHALAAVIIGEVIVQGFNILLKRKTSNVSSFIRLLAPPLLGAIVYIIIRSSAIWILSEGTRGTIGTNTTTIARPQDLNLIFGGLLIIVVVIAKLAGIKSSLWSGETADL